MNILAPETAIPSFDSTRGGTRCVAFYSKAQGWMARYPQFDGTCAAWSFVPFDDEAEADAFAHRCNARSNAHKPWPSSSQAP